MIPGSEIRLKYTGGVGLVMVVEERAFGLAAVDDELVGEDDNKEVGTEGRKRGEEAVGATGLEVGEEGEKDADLAAGYCDFTVRGSSSLGFGLFVCFVPKIFNNQNI